MGTMRDASEVQRRLPALLEKVRDYAQEELAGLFTDMMNGADDALFALAEKAGSDKDQALYFDSMRELRIKRKGMERTFSREIQAAFEALQRVQPATEAATQPEELGIEGFQLVQDDELEEGLAVDTMVKKARAVNEVALNQIVTRLDTVVPTRRVDASNNPVDPLVIANAFRTAARSLDLEIKAKLIVYKLFERHVMNVLEEVYSDINAFLAQNGILPDLASKVVTKRRRRSGASEPGNPARDHAESNRGDVGTEGDSGEILAVLHELLAATKARTGQAMEPSAAGQPAVETSTLLEALTRVQAQAPVITQPNQLKETIGQVLPAQVARNGQAFGQANDDVIDIISMLFDFILGDRNLPDEMKAIIGRLQIPMLKVALIDKSFFAKAAHPARKLLNEMARAGLGWSPGEAGHQGGLKPKMEAIVARVLEEFDDDPSLFAELLEDFEAFLEEQQRKAEMIEARTRQAEEGRAKTEAARTAADALLRQLTSGWVLPETVNVLLMEAWRHVLFLCFLREGPDGEPWKQAVKTAEDLMASLVVPTDIEGRKAMTARLPHIIHRLKQGLDAAAYGTFESARLFQELEQLHRRVLKGEPVLERAESDRLEAAQQTRREPEIRRDLDKLEAISQELDSDLSDISETTSSADIDVEPAGASDAKVEGLDEELAGLPIEEIELRAPGAFAEDGRDTGGLPEDDEYLVKVDGLQAGSWFEIRQEGQVMRCKLAAVIPTVGKYIFVNRTGLKVADYTRSGLAVAMRRREVTQLEEGALFDRALESVIANLRSLKNKGDRVF
jgi:hypothetical protein